MYKVAAYLKPSNHWNAKAARMQSLFLLAPIDVPAVGEWFAKSRPEQTLDDFAEGGGVEMRTWEAARSLASASVACATNAR
jgi:hypothetical protein